MFIPATDGEDKWGLDTFLKNSYENTAFRQCKIKQTEACYRFPRSNAWFWQFMDAKGLIISLFSPLLSKNINSNKHRQNGKGKVTWPILHLRNEHILTQKNVIKNFFCFYEGKHLLNKWWKNFNFITNPKSVGTVGINIIGKFNGTKRKIIEIEIHKKK